MSDIFKVFDVDNKKCYTSLHKYFKENQERLGAPECRALKRVVEDKCAQAKLNVNEYGVLLNASAQAGPPSTHAHVFKRDDAERLYNQAMQGIVIDASSLPTAATIDDVPQRTRKRIPYQPKN